MDEAHHRRPPISWTFRRQRPVWSNGDYSSDTEQQKVAEISRSIASVVYGEEDASLLLSSLLFEEGTNDTTNLFRLLPWNVQFRLWLRRHQQQQAMVVVASSKQPQPITLLDDGHDVLKTVLVEVRQALLMMRQQQQLEQQDPSSSTAARDEHHRDHHVLSPVAAAVSPVENDLLWMNDDDTDADLTSSSWKNDWMIQQWTTTTNTTTTTTTGLARYYVLRDVHACWDRWTPIQQQDVETILSCVDQLVGLIVPKQIHPIQSLSNNSNVPLLDILFQARSPLEVCHSYFDHQDRIMQQQQKRLKTNTKPTVTARGTADRSYDDDNNTTAAFREWIASKTTKQDSSTTESTSFWRQEVQHACHVFGGVSSSFESSGGGGAQQRRDCLLWSLHHNKAISSTSQNKGQEEYLSRLLRELLLLQPEKQKEASRHSSLTTEQQPKTARNDYDMTQQRQQQQQLLRGRALLVSFLISKRVPGYQHAKAQLSPSPLRSILHLNKSSSSTRTQWSSPVHHGFTSSSSSLEALVHDFLQPRTNASTRIQQSYHYQVQNGHHAHEDLKPSGQSPPSSRIPDVEALVIDLWELLTLRIGKGENSNGHNTMSAAVLNSVTKFASWLPSDPIVKRYQYLLRCVLQDGDPPEEAATRMNEEEHRTATGKPEDRSQWCRLIRDKMATLSAPGRSHLVLHATKFVQTLTNNVHNMDSNIDIETPQQPDHHGGGAWIKIFDAAFCRDVLMPLVHGFCLVTSTEMDVALALPTLTRTTILCCILESVITEQQQSKRHPWWQACPHLASVFDTVGECVIPLQEQDARNAMSALVRDVSQRMRHVYNMAFFPSTPEQRIPSFRDYIDSVVIFALSSPTFANHAAPDWCRHVVTVCQQHWADEELCLQWIPCVLSNAVGDTNAMKFTLLMRSLHEVVALRVWDRQLVRTKETPKRMLSDILLQEHQTKPGVHTVRCLQEIIRCTPPQCLFSQECESSDFLTLSLERMLTTFGGDNMDVACVILTGSGLLMDGIRRPDNREEGNKSARSSCTETVRDYLKRASEWCNSRQGSPDELRVLFQLVKRGLAGCGAIAGLQWWEVLCSEFPLHDTSAKAHAYHSDVMEKLDSNLKLLEQMSAEARTSRKRQRPVTEDVTQVKLPKMSENSTNEKSQRGRSRELGSARTVLQKLWGDKKLGSIPIKDAQSSNKTNGHHASLEVGLTTSDDFPNGHDEYGDDEAEKKDNQGEDDHDDYDDDDDRILLLDL